MAQTRAATGSHRPQPEQLECVVSCLETGAVTWGQLRGHDQGRTELTVRGNRDGAAAGAGPGDEPGARQGARGACGCAAPTTKARAGAPGSDRGHGRSAAQATSAAGARPGARGTGAAGDAGVGGGGLRLPLGSEARRPCPGSRRPWNPRPEVQCREPHCPPALLFTACGPNSRPALLRQRQTCNPCHVSVPSRVCERRHH